MTAPDAGLPGLSPGLAQAFGQSVGAVAVAGLAETFALSAEVVEPLLEIHHRAAEDHDHQAQRLVVGDLPIAPLSDDVLDGRGPRSLGLVEFEAQQVVDTAHNSSPSLVTGVTSVGETPDPAEQPPAGSGHSTGGAL